MIVLFHKVYILAKAGKLKNTPPHELTFHMLSGQTQTIHFEQVDVARSRVGALALTYQVPDCPDFKPWRIKSMELPIEAIEQYYDIYLTTDRFFVAFTNGMINRLNDDLKAQRTE